MSWRRNAQVATALAIAVASPAALAHWCHDIFASSYNLVIRPAVDTLSVPTTGSATLDVYAQNNLGYPLQAFTLSATATGYTITIARHTSKVSGYLMPGESLRHTLTISRSGGATLSVDNINFYVRMGTGAGDQSRCYGGDCNSPGMAAAVIKKTTGATYPVGPLSVPNPTNAWDQAEHLRHAAQADFGDTNTGIDNLLMTYCSGRLTWRYESVLTACCPDSNTTICPPATCNGSRAWSTVSASDATGADGPHLWAGGELAIRKSALGSRATTFRDRLKCSWSDPWLLMRGYAAFLLGYLGEEADARTFLQNIITSGTTSADDKLVAKASLMLMRNATDISTHRAAVTTGASSANRTVAYICAAALGIVDGDDAIVNSVLVPAARWSYPFDTNDPHPVFAGQMLNLVAWERRGWAPNGGDTGRVCFYETCGAPDTTDPASPAGVSCTPGANGTVRVNWSQVTQDVNGGAESVASYRVYRGTAARPAGCTRPAASNCSGFDYANADTTTAIYRDFPALTGTSTFYFAVTAVDQAGNASNYSTEVNCRPRYAPVAQITCDTPTGTAPLTVNCNGTQSTDPNGASDITGYAFRLDGAAAQNQSSVTYNFANAGVHQLQLTVTDSTGLTGTATTTITVNASSGNQPPTARAAANPTTGPTPLTVAFSSAGSADPDNGQTLTYSWNFDDGSGPSTNANPSHTFANAGTYSVVLTVTDNGTPNLSSTALVSVTATGNRPPDVQAATVSPQSGQAPLTVQYDATGVTDPDGHAVAVTWSFGDGTANSTQRTGTHTFAQVGTYTVAVEAQDDGLPAIGPARREFALTVTNQPAGNRPPDCSAATVSPLSGQTPLSVTLDASGCTDPDGDTLTYTWRVPISMTEEETFNTAVASYRFTEPKRLTIALSVVDNAASPLETNLTFDVNVTPGRAEDVVGVCGCSSASVLPGAVALLVAAVVRRRRRPSS